MDGSGWLVGAVIRTPEPPDMRRWRLRAIPVRCRRSNVAARKCGSLLFKSITQEHVDVADNYIYMYIVDVAVWLGAGFATTKVNVADGLH